MYDYYFKIKKGDIEFECSTTDKILFEQKLSDWINGVVQGKTVEAPIDATIVDTNFDVQDRPERSGFIDVKNLTSINEMTAPDFHFIKESINLIEEEANFETALKESIQNPMTDVTEKADSASQFEEFYNKYEPSTDMDRLIVTSLYILNEENQERFTLKNINAKLVPLCGNPVDHSIIQDAIEQNYVKIVPDLTDTSEFTEYTLTSDGEGYFVV